MIGSKTLEHLEDDKKGRSVTARDHPGSAYGASRKLNKPLNTKALTMG
jgi:hypothetical protein